MLLGPRHSTFIPRVCKDSFTNCVMVRNCDSATGVSVRVVMDHHDSLYVVYFDNLGNAKLSPDVAFVLVCNVLVACGLREDLITAYPRRPTK